MSKNSDLLHIIDKCTAVTATNVANLTDELKDHKEADKERKEEEKRWQCRLEAAAKLCPESEHIKTQNGKIDRMSTKIDNIDTAVTTIANEKTWKVKAVKTIAGVALFVVALLGAWIAWQEMAKGAEVGQLVQCEARDIDRVLAYMNQSERATYLDVQFACDNKTDKTPILKVITMHKCLNCKNCFDYINKTKEDFLDIGDYWYKLFGTHRVDIYNKHGILKCQVLENK